MPRNRVLAACPDAATYGRAKYMLSHGKVIRRASVPGMAVGTVEDGQQRYAVRVSIAPDGFVGFCACSAGRPRRLLCSHAAALLLAGEDAPGPAARTLSAEQLLENFELPIMREPCLRMHPSLDMAAAPSLSLRVGINRLYVVGDLRAFLREYRAGSAIRMGKGLTIDPVAQCFPPDSEALLALIEEALDLLDLHGAGDGRLRSLPLSDAQLVQALGHMQDMPFTLILDGQEHKLQRIYNGLPELSFDLRAQEGALVLSSKALDGCRALDRDARFLWMRGEVYRPSDRQRSAIAPFLHPDAPSEYRFFAGQRERLVSEVLPRLEGSASVSMDSALLEAVIDEPLAARATLDLDGADITCALVFGYGAHQIQPFAPQAREGDSILKRDAARERNILDVLSRHGFRVKSGGAYLSGDDAIYDFLVDGVPALQALCEVFSSKELLSLRPRKARPSGRLSMGGGGLEFRLMLEGIEQVDHDAILSALRERKEYVRLGDGSFLSIARDEEWSQLADYLDEAGGIAQQGVLRMQAYRAAYLDALLEASALPVERDESVRAIARELRDPRDEEPPIEGMRPYQRRGFAWLVALAQLNMGGILADDMGLGKTLQVLALIEWARRKEGSAPSLVVAPTTLTYNWLDEVNKFAPHLTAVVLSGTAAQRRAQALAAQDCDLIIISYAQVRKDAEHIKEIPFRYVVLDEAQQIKNAATVGAESVKLLNAQARFALTGTPMENHPGELWSIFEFVLPGYLGPYDEFSRRYGGGTAAQDLSRRIRPFLMRRLKRDVLADLPEKLEQRIVVELTPKQREVYSAVLSKTREELEELSQGGLERSRFRILAAITRLRQICCHPSLYLDGYQGGSGKLELLLELVRDALDADHRILLFSQFTSMLALIGEELKAAGIPWFYLDGKVPALERMEMVDRFNALERPVFLISLRAGGTGLNLTAADTVIHYDPWWNPAVEDQATDRAHRIGQQKVVQVIKLVSRDTIEEKVFDLKNRKQEWIDRIIEPGEAMPTQLSTQEILSLFH